MNFSKTLGLSILTCACAAAVASDSPKLLDFATPNVGVAMQKKQDDNNIYLGVTGSIYFPTQDRVKNAFNTQIFYYGVTAAQNNLDYNWKVRPDFGFFAATHNSNRLFIVPVELAISRKFAQPGGDFQPYAKLGAGIAYMNYHIEEPSGTSSSSRFGFTGSAEAGVILGQRIRVFAAYDWYSKQSGFDFSGFQIGATVSVFKL